MALCVLHIGKFYPPYRGGMEVFLADLISEQRRQGIDAHALVHGDPEPDDPPWIKRVPVQFSLVYAPIAIGFRSALSEAIARIKPDVLHLHLPNNSALWALTLPDARRVPWVIHWHSDVVVSNIKLSVALAYILYRPFEQALLERCTQIFATSPRYLEASDALKTWRNKCHVAPLGINLEHTPSSLELAGHLRWSPKSKLRLLSIGRLTYYKGFETLIQAVIEMPHVELKIVGDGELKNSLQQFIDNSTSAENTSSIQLTGPISDEDKHALLASCDVFCLASRERTEAFGVVILEAMMHARPCIVTDLPGSGMPWLVSQSKNGLLVAFEDIAAWRSGIARLKHDPELRQRMGKAGQKALHEHFSIAPCAVEIERHYRAMVPESNTVAWHDGILIVICAKDQEDSIASLVKRASELLPNAKILVVDNRSSDATAHLAERCGALVLRPLLAMTSWGALQTGLRYAKTHGYSRVVTVDMDGWYEVEELPSLLFTSDKSDNPDITVAYFRGNHSLLRRAAWQWYRMITGLQLRDFVSSYRLYTPAAIEVATSTEATLLDYQDVGTLMLMRRNGLKIREIELTMKTPKQDNSGIFRSWAQAMRYMLVSTLLGLALRGLR